MRGVSLSSYGIESCVCFVDCASVGGSHISESIDVDAKMFVMMEGLWGFLVNLICSVILFESGNCGYLCFVWCHVLVGPCSAVKGWGFCLLWYIDEAYSTFFCFSS